MPAGGAPARSSRRRAQRRRSPTSGGSPQRGEVPMREGNPPRRLQRARLARVPAHEGGAERDPRRRRRRAQRPTPAAPARDAATLLDESGALVACADPRLLALLAAARLARGVRRAGAALARRFAVVGRSATGCSPGSTRRSAASRPRRWSCALDPVGAARRPRRPPATRSTPPPRRASCDPGRGAARRVTCCRCRSRRCADGTRRMRATRASPTCRFFARCGGRGTAPPRHSVGEASVAMLTS